MPKVHVRASASTRRGKGERGAILLLCELVRMRNERSWQGRKGAEQGGAERGRGEGVKGGRAETGRNVEFGRGI